MRERERDYFVCVSREIFDEHKLPLRDARLYVVQEEERERERLSRESTVLTPRRPASQCIAARVLLAPGKPGEIEVEIASTSGPLMHMADQCVADDRALIGRVSGGSALVAHTGSWTVPHGR